MLSHEQKILFCAEAAHDMNAIYCRSLGDFSQASWGVAEDWQRDSAIKGVMGVLRGNNPQQSHESWLKEKEAAGWKFGPVKDPIAKVHPCFLPYDQLPPEQSVKDELFISSVRAMASALGLGYRIRNLDGSVTDICERK